MELFDTTKSIIENLYLLSAPLLLVVALIGLRHIKIAKDNIKITSKRQAITMSFEICEKYEKSINKHYENLYAKMIELNIVPEKLNPLNPSQLDNLSESITNHPEFRKCLDNYDELAFHQRELANELEGYSVAFVKGIADEELAYDLQFTQFYYWCMICLPEIFEINNAQERIVEQIPYCNLCELYSIWKARNEKEILSRQVANLTMKSARIKERKIDPVGIK